VENGRSERKRQAILTAARAAFLEHGYAGTSMDQIAAAAAVSKQTVYKHFADKDRLFESVVTGDISDAEQQSRAVLAALPDSDDLATDLRGFARQHLVTVTQPHLIRLRRVVIAAADRFPDLADTWYANGPERGAATLADRFARLAERGRLRLDDPLLAAQHFNWLVLSIPLNRAMFRPTAEPYTPAELDHYADEGVRVFLAAYGSG
jgi:AcrR family transcriptional regulator